MASEPLGRALTCGREPQVPTRLDETTLKAAVSQLAAADHRLGRLYETNGLPPLWRRPTGFATLVKIILEQQVSLDSAAAAFANLESAIGEVTPAGFLHASDDELKEIGFSRQKAGYCRGLATGLVDGSLDLGHLENRDDASALAYLVAIRGIGPWTADVYLLFALSRSDVWPRGDRALAVSMMENLGFDDVPTYEAAERLAQRWRPWRSVAARMLWHGYLLSRGRTLE